MDSLPSRIEYWANTQPDKLALDDLKNQLSYGQLRKQMRAYMHLLEEAGVTRGNKVILSLPKSNDAVAALLAIMGTGAAYVPVDMNAPRARREAIWQDAGPQAAILVDAQDSLTAIPVICSSDVVSERLSSASFELHDDDDAYVLYTSGSTGKPNGVRISHGAINHFFYAANQCMDVDNRSVYLNTSALFFDASVIDVLHPLYHGSTVILSPELVLPEIFLKIIEQRHVSHMSSVGTTMNMIAESPGFDSRDLRSLRRYMAGAEVLNIRIVERWMMQCPNLFMINGYGPTEMTCVCLTYTFDRFRITEMGSSPIGYPLPGLLIHIDGDLEGDDRVGELWVCGPQQMSGYLNREQLNREKFKLLGGKRFYRTGDIVRQDMHGRISYVGRLDSQVKIRGYRIDLGEVESAYTLNTGVIAAVAAPIEHQKQGQCLVVAVETKGGLVDLEALNKEVSARLPRHMRPKQVFHFDAMPTKSTGKIDVRDVREKIQKRYMKLMA